MKTKTLSVRSIRVLITTVLLLIAIPVSAVSALSSGFKAPGSNSIQGGNTKWLNPANGYASDNVYATAGKNKWVAYGTFGFSIPAGATITGIEVSIEGQTAGQDIDASLSWNGSNFTAAKNANFTPNAPDTIIILGGPADTWGRTWAVTDFSNANFKLRLKATNVVGNFLLDQARVKVYFNPPPATLTVTAVTGTYGNSANLSARFRTNGGLPISGKTISFTLASVSACNGVTNANGLATCSAALTPNIGDYPTGVGASFAGDANYDPASGAAALTINPRALTIKADNASKTYGDTLAFAGTEFTTTGLFGSDAVSSVTLASAGAASGATVAGSPYAITPSAAIGSGLGNYTITYSNGALAVTRKALTVSGVTASNKIYDGTTIAALGGTASLVGVVGSDDVTLGGTPIGAFSDKNVGVGKTVTIAGYTINGASIGNYTLSQPIVFASIDPLGLTISGVLVNNKTYDGGVAATLNAGAAALATPIDGDDVDLDDSSASATFNNKHAGNNKPVTASGFALIGADAGNYSLTQPTGLTANISPLEVAVTAITDTKVYDGTTDSSGTPNVSPAPVGGDTASFTQSFNNKHVGTGKTLTPSGAVSDGNGGANYALSFVSVFDGEITPLAITVTAVTDSKVYDGTTASSGTPNISPALVGSDVANFMQSFDNKNVGANKTIAPAGFVIDGNDGNNYSVSFVNTGTGEITSKALAVTADNKAKLAGNSDPAFTFSASGFISPDTFDPAPTCSVSGEHDIEGTYTIACSGGSAGTNYNITYVDGTLTVTNKTILNVTAANQTIAYGDPDPSFAPEYSGFDPGDDETVLNTAPTCNATGPFTHVASPFVIACSGGADDKYEFNYTSGALTVNTRTIAVTAEAKNKTYGATDPALTYTYDPALVGSDTFSGQLLRNPGEDVGAHAITQGTLSLSNNYSINYVGADLTVTKATLTITANNKTIWFSQPDPVFTASYAGLQNGDTPAVLNTAPTCGVTGAHTAAGSYPINCSGAADNNYDFSYVAGTLTVKAPLLATYKSFGRVDGWVLESSETSGKGGSMNGTATTFLLGDNAANKQYRSILSFNTSLLPDNAVIVSVTLKFKHAGVSGTSPFNTHGKLLADIRKGAFSGNKALQIGDFSAAASKNKTLLFTNKVNNWYSKSLNPVNFLYLNLGGVTQFRLRFTLDDNNDFGADFLKIYSGNAAEANRPQLVVEYFVP